MENGSRESVEGANRPRTQGVTPQDQSQNLSDQPVIAVLSWMLVDGMQSINVGGTAELFSSLNLRLGDFCVLALCSLPIRLRFGESLKGCETS